MWVTFSGIQGWPGETREKGNFDCLARCHENLERSVILSYRRKRETVVTYSTLFAVLYHRRSRVIKRHQSVVSYVTIVS